MESQMVSRVALSAIVVNFSPEKTFMRNERERHDIRRGADHETMETLRRMSPA